MRRSATAEEKRHMARVAGLGCVLCRHLKLGETSAEVHHVRIKVGWGRDGHGNVIGLCPEHHTGKTGVHSMGRQQFTDLHGVSELELLSKVKEELGIS